MKIIESMRSPAAAARAVLETVFGRIDHSGFDVELWDGSRLWPATRRPEFVLVFRSPETVRKVFDRCDSLSFGEAFIHGMVDVAGSMAATFPMAESLMRIPWSFVDRCKLARLLWSIPQPARIAGGGVFGGVAPAGSLGTSMRTREAVNYHYDHPVEFWRLWLDESLCYSCAYFRSPGVTLAQAQQDKLDYVCRKLRLEPGMRLLDLGCGWGALVAHACRCYGVDAVGITLSPHQAKVAQARVEEAGLSRRCQIVTGDFLELDGLGRFDRISSIGAAEHIPENRFAAYFTRIRDLLRPGGQALHHAITRNPSIPDRPGGSFMDRYVFPDHFLASIGRTVSLGEEAGLEVRDVENLREHYALTLEHWLRRLEGARDSIEAVTDPVSFRVFRLYLAGSAYEFRCGRLGLYQTLLTRADPAQACVVSTRKDWYREAACEPAAGAIAWSE